MNPESYWAPINIHQIITFNYLEAFISVQESYIHHMSDRFQRTILNVQNSKHFIFQFYQSLSGRILAEAYSNWFSAWP